MIQIISLPHNNKNSYLSEKVATILNVYASNNMTKRQTIIIVGDFYTPLHELIEQQQKTLTL